MRVLSWPHVSLWMYDLNIKKRKRKKNRSVVLLSHWLLLSIQIKLFVPMRSCHPNSMSEMETNAIDQHCNSLSRPVYEAALVKQHVKWHQRMIFSASEWMLVCDFPPGWLLIFSFYSIRISCTMTIMRMTTMIITVMILHQICRKLVGFMC